MFGDRLKLLRKDSGYTQANLADEFGLDKSSIAKYEKSGVTPSPDILVRIANFFNVSVDYLLGNVNAPNLKNGKKIPVLGEVQAGIPIEAIEDILDYEEITEAMASSGDHFGLRIRGASMEPRIREGDVVIVRKQSDVDSGDVAVVLVNGDSATVKKVVKQRGGISLVSSNPDFEPRFYTNNEVESLPIAVIGRVVELRAKF